MRMKQHHHLRQLCVGHCERLRETNETATTVTHADGQKNSVKARSKMHMQMPIDNTQLKNKCLQPYTFDDHVLSFQMAKNACNALHPAALLLLTVTFEKMKQVGTKVHFGAHLFARFF
jgi:hypothetical protein